MLFGSRLKKRFIGLLGLTALGLAVHFLDEQRPQPADLFSDVPEQAEEPDYYAVKSTYREYNEEGVLSRSLSSERLLHYPDSEQATLEHPVITTFDAEGRPAWRARAETGFIEGDGDFFQLQNKVLIRQLPAAGADSSGMQLRTEQLDINLNTRLAETDLPVRIITDQGITRATGLSADMNNNHIVLKSRVHSQYQTTQKAETDATAPDSVIPETTTGRQPEATE